MVAVNRYNLIRSVSRESFFDFFQYFWEVINPDEPLGMNWHIPLLCNELQSMAERVFRRQKSEYDLIVNIPPGTTKSSIASVMFPAWMMARKPTVRVICASNTDQLSLDLSDKCREVVKSKLYRSCFPEVELRGDRDAKGNWGNTAMGFRMAFTAGGKSPTGFHAHFIIVDDPIDPQKVLSEAEIKAVNGFMNGTLPTRKVNKEVTPIALIMQRLHQDDPSGNRLAHWAKGKGDPVRHFCLPATLEFEVFPKELERNYQNGLLDPNRLSPSILKPYRDKGQYYWSGQFGQRPVPLGGGMFKTERFVISEAPPEMVSIVRFWDKAATQEDGCYTVGVKMGRDKEGRIWVLDVVRGQWESAERERVIQNVARMDGYHVKIGLEEEGGSGGKDSVRFTTRRLHGYILQSERPTGDKTLRADPYSVQVNEGNVFLKRANWNEDYIDELKHFPTSTYKDQVDASSGAYKMVTKTPLVIGGMSRAK